MKADRAVLEKEILYFIDMFRPGSSNVDIYKDLFSRMNDKEFFSYIESLDNGNILPLYVPPAEEPLLTIDNLEKVAKALDFSYRQHLYLTDPGTGQVYKTQAKHFIGMLPVRRQVQMLVKKSSIPQSNHIVDERTGQATGESKGSRLSGPEINVNASKGLTNMVIELIKFRGGDEKSYNAMNKSIIETGEVSMASIMAETPSTVKSNKTLHIYLKGGMHLKNTILD